jgi:hypothetical protein
MVKATANFASPPTIARPNAPIACNPKASALAILLSLLWQGFRTGRKGFAFCQGFGASEERFAPQGGSQQVDQSAGVGVFGVAKR